MGDLPKTVKANLPNIKAGYLNKDIYVKTFKKMVADLSGVRPGGTCVYFQGENLQQLGKSYSQGGLDFTSSGGDLSLMVFPAPPDPLPWLQPKATVTYLYVSNPACLEVRLPAPATWIGVSLAKAPTPGKITSPTNCTIDLYVMNEKNTASGVKSAPIADPFGHVRSYEFSRGEKTYVQTPPHTEEIGPFTKLWVMGNALLLWRICYL